MLAVHPQISPENNEFSGKWRVLIESSLDATDRYAAFVVSNEEDINSLVNSLEERCSQNSQYIEE